MSGLSSIPVAILAGWLATRLRPLTEKLPKVLLPVAGRPFLDHQLDLLRGQGFRRIVLCVGHLGELVREQFGDGRSRGVEIEYSFDGAALLGTGGALLRARGLLGERFLVMYGDSYLPVEFAPVVECFERSGRLGLMTVFRNQGLYDTSNVVFRDSEIVAYDKKRRLPEMDYIDYGLSAFRAAAFDGWPDDRPFDLGDVMQNLLARKQLAAFEVHRRFYEIGSPAGLAELEAYLPSEPVNES
jgi:NDP-sugar pyrophosphorylase family protein